MRSIRKNWMQRWSASFARMQRPVIGLGVKNSTSDLLMSNCDEFIFYDDLVLKREPGVRRRRSEVDALVPLPARAPDREPCRTSPGASLLRGSPFLPGGPRVLRRGDHFLGGFGQRFRADDGQAALIDDPTAFLDVGAGEADDDRAS